MKKTCTKCKKEKPLSYFHNSIREKDGKVDRCKICVNEWMINKHRQMKFEIMQRYGGKCECCGEAFIEFLVVDHIDGGGNKERIECGSGVALYRKLLKQPKHHDLRVLCANCNTSYGAFGYCPHEDK